MSEVNDETSEVTAVKERRRKATTAYPKSSLKDCLRIAQSIEDNNAGQPWNRLDIALALDLSPESSTIRTLITSSSKYGLTEGSYAAEKLSITELGKSIVSPRTDEEKNGAIAQALQNVDVFKKFFERFNSKKLPDEQLLKNTISRDFGIPSEDAEGCLNVLKKNLEDWGIVVDYKGNKWVRLDKLSGENLYGSPAAQTTLAQDEEEEAVVDIPDIGTLKTSIPQKVAISPTPAITPPNNHVFISYSKNNEILDQIKTILTFGQFDPVVAEEVETTSIPIPDKVFGLMKNCNAAIINISADESEKNGDGSYRVNPNVLIEIGGAFLMYNKKVILLADKRVSIPSNLQGLYRCEYEGDELGFKTSMKLLAALANFRTMN